MPPARINTRDGRAFDNLMRITKAKLEASKIIKSSSEAKEQNIEARMLRLLREE